jgi:hypothetical protein
VEAPLNVVALNSSNMESVLKAFTIVVAILGLVAAQDFEPVYNQSEVTVKVTTDGDLKLHETRELSGEFQLWIFIRRLFQVTRCTSRSRSGTSAGSG